MKTKLLFSGLALVVLCTSGCDLKRLRGNGNVTTQTRPVTDFSKLDAGGYYEVEWHPGAPSLSIKTDENLLERITTKVVGDRLKIEMEEPVAPTEWPRKIEPSASASSAGGRSGNKWRLRGVRPAKP